MRAVDGLTVDFEPSANAVLKLVDYFLYFSLSFGTEVFSNPTVHFPLGPGSLLFGGGIVEGNDHWQLKG